MPLLLFQTSSAPDANGEGRSSAIRLHGGPGWAQFVLIGGAHALAAIGSDPGDRRSPIREADNPQGHHASNTHHSAEECQCYQDECPRSALAGDNAKRHAHRHGRQADDDPGPKQPQRPAGRYDPPDTDSDGERPSRREESASRLGVVM